MKRNQIIMTIVTVIFYLAAATLAMAEDTYPRLGGAIKAGIGLAGSHEVEALGMSVDTDVDSGFEAAAELLGHLNEHVDLGVGVAYQAERDLDVGGAFQFIPVYGTVKLRAGTDTVDPYLVGQLGYGFMSGNAAYRGTGVYEVELSGGLYYGGGVGVIIAKHFIVETLYTVNNGTGEWMGLEGDIEYRKVVVNLGINF